MYVMSQKKTHYFDYVDIVRMELSDVQLFDLVKGSSIEGV